MKHVLAAVLTLACGIAQAGPVIYDNQASVNHAWSSDVAYPDFQADDFVLLPGATTIADIHWTGVYAPTDTPSATDNFTIQIFANSSGAPGALLHTVFNGDPGRTDTGTDLFSIYDLYAYSVDITPLTLAAGTIYWLSIFNDTTADTNDSWYWSTEVGAGNSMRRASSTDTWQLTGNRQDFQLTTVPEPATLALLGIGLSGLGFARRTSPRIYGFHPKIKRER